jgi:hypothetical protein
LKDLAAIHQPKKKNGYFEHGNDVVTWCFGHMLEIYDPEDYDAEVRKVVIIYATDPFNAASKI